MLETCDPNPGLNQYSYFIDFTNPPDNLEDDWSTSNHATITYNTKGKNGAEFTFAKRYDAPQLFTNFYIFFGRVDVEMQVAPGVGIISSSVLMSDDFDEIDWEMSGNNFNLTSQYPGGVVQNNYFSKGITGNYDRGMWVPLANPQTTFYTYSVDWTPTKLDWLVNGKVMRTFYAKDADSTTHQYPQTPSKIQLGLWNGGDPEQNDGTKRWAGGITDFSKAPFTMFVKSVRITNYNPAKYYNWTDQSGAWKSIKSLNITLPDPTTAAPTTTATTLEPLRTELPVSPNGHCGSKAGTICKGSLFGDCCSFYNYCGNTTEYCGLGCQSAFGICGPMNPIATTGVSLAPPKTASPSTIVAEPSTAGTSVLTTITISLSRPTAKPTSAEPELSTGRGMSTAPSTAASQPTQPLTTTTQPIKGTEPDVPTTQALPVPPGGTVPTRGPSPGTTLHSPPTSKIPVPPVIEKPVVSTGKSSPTGVIVSHPPAASTATQKSEPSTRKSSSSSPPPTSKAPTSSRPISAGSQDSKPASTSTSTSTRANASTAKTSAPGTKAPAPTTTTTTTPTAKTTAAPTRGPVTTGSPTTAARTTGPNLVATTLPAKPQSTASPKPGPRELCFWWRRWYCWHYKRAYPLDGQGYPHAQD